MMPYHIIYYNVIALNCVNDRDKQRSFNTELVKMTVGWIPFKKLYNPPFTCFSRTGLTNLKRLRIPNNLQ